MQLSSKQVMALVVGRGLWTRRFPTTFSSCIGPRNTTQDYPLITKGRVKGAQAASCKELALAHSRCM